MVFKPKVEFMETGFQSGNEVRKIDFNWQTDIFMKTDFALKSCSPIQFLFLSTACTAGPSGKASFSPIKSGFLHYMHGRTLKEAPNVLMRR